MDTKVSKRLFFRANRKTSTILHYTNANYGKQAAAQLFYTLNPGKTLLGGVV